MNKLNLAIAMTTLLAVGGASAIKQAYPPAGQHAIEITKEMADAVAASGQNLTVEFEKDRPATMVAHK